MVSTLVSCDVDHVPKSTRLSLCFSALGSKVICIIVEEGEPGNEATLYY